MKQDGIAFGEQSINAGCVWATYPSHDSQDYRQTAEDLFELAGVLERDGVPSYVDGSAELSWGQLTVTFPTEQPIRVTVDTLVSMAVLIESGAEGADADLRAHAEVAKRMDDGTYWDWRAEACRT